MILSYEILGLHENGLKFSSDFNHSSALREIIIKVQIRNSTKNPLGTEIYHADGWKDG
jgi:hypothetical protein